MDFQIENFTEQDAFEMAQIEKKVFTCPWSVQSILSSFFNGTYFFVAKNSLQIIGYAGVQLVLDEGYITNIAVLSEYRNKGIGTSLIKEVFNFCKQNKVKSISLEVRKSNLKAIKLYEAHGFKIVGNRKKFYQKPQEDAIIMTTYFNSEEN